MEKLVINTKVSILSPKNLAEPSKFHLPNSLYKPDTEISTMRRKSQRTSRQNSQRNVLKPIPKSHH